MKENKLWEIQITRITRNDVTGEERHVYPVIYRYGVSEKQVEARLRHSLGYNDYDDEYGATSVEYIFDIVEVVKSHGFEQLSLFEF